MHRARGSLAANRFDRAGRAVGKSAGELAVARGRQRIGQGDGDKVADADAVEVVPASLIQVVTQLQDIVTGLAKRAVDRRVFAQPGDVVAIGDFAARRVEEAESGVQQRPDPTCVDLERRALPRFDVELEIVQLLRPRAPSTAVGRLNAWAVLRETFAPVARTVGRSSSSTSLMGVTPLFVATRIP